MDSADVGIRLLPIAAVVKKAGISRPYIWRLVGQGECPGPLQPSAYSDEWVRQVANSGSRGRNFYHDPGDMDQIR